MSDYICIVLYMISCVLFIMGIKKLGKADTARKGNLYSSVGMLIAVVSVLISQDVIDGGWLSYLLIVLAIAGGSVVGFIWAKKVEMTGMPQLVALFNGFGGLSSMLVAVSQYTAGVTEDWFTALTLGLTRRPQDVQEEHHDPRQELHQRRHPRYRCYGNPFPLHLT